MNQDQQKDFGERAKALLAFAKEKEIFISAVQQINKENGYIETVPLYRDMKQYTKDVEIKETNA